MAKIAFSTPTSTPVTGRRRLAGGLFAIVAGGTLTSGIAAGFAASVGDLIPTGLDADAHLTSLRAELTAAVADISMCEMNAGWSDDQIDQASDRLHAACWAIIDAPIAQTSAGLALKSAAVMQQLRLGYSHGSWRNDAEAMAWRILSPLAGCTYVPPYLPERTRVSCEPERA